MLLTEHDIRRAQRDTIVQVSWACMDSGGRVCIPAVEMYRRVLTYAST